MKYADLFTKFYREAMIHHRGLWKSGITKEKCLSLNSQWGSFGLFPQEECNVRTIDSGETCDDGVDCEGDCIAVLTSEQWESVSRGEALSIEGKCSQWALNIGCHPFVEGGKVEGILCVD